MSYIGSTPTTQSFIAGTDYFNGTGSAVNFTLSRSVNSVNDIEVIVNNVEQIPSGYSVSGTTLTFSAAPSSGTSNVYVRYLSTTNLSLAIPAGTSASFNTLAYTGTLTGGTGVVNLGSGQVYKDASGNVGIGVVPSANWGTYKVIQLGEQGVLSGYATGAGVLNIGANFYWNGSGYKYLTTNPATLYQQNAGAHNWRVAASGTADAAVSFNTAMTLDANGNLAVGTTSAITGYKVHTAGAFYQDQTANGNSGTPVVSGGYVCGPADANIYAGIRFLNSYLSNNASQLAFYVNNTTGNAYEAARINSSGALLINRTTQANTERFTIAGNTGSQCMALISPITSAYDMCNIFNGNGQVGLIGTNGTATSYATSSDYRLKEQVQPMTGALAKVALLKPCTYKWKVDGSDGQGFIAHELDEVVPGCVTGEKDAVETYMDEDGVEQTRPKYQGIDTSFLVATLTAAIQEQQTLITALTARITALESK